ncbi:MAG: hypothetical protein HFF28_00635 [Oscillospiraceae bacterium]|nr:hypothetical protein [Oscillospiraceae bacterium]
MGTFGIQAALNQMDQACESINKAMCAIDSFRQRPDIKLLDIAVDYLKEAGGEHLQQADKFLTLHINER